MYISQKYVQSGIFPFATPPISKHLGSSLRELAFAVYPIADCFLVGAFRTPGAGGTALRGTTRWYQANNGSNASDASSAPAFGIELSSHLGRRDNEF